METGKSLNKNERESMLKESRVTVSNPAAGQREINLVRKSINLMVAGGSAVAMASGDFPLITMPFYLLGAALAGEALGIITGSLIYEARSKEKIKLHD